MRTIPETYICELVRQCSVPCTHSVPHLPLSEQPGLCHEVSMICGEDNETPCLCVPVNSCSDYLPQEKGVSCLSLNELEVRLNPGGAR